MNAFTNIYFVEFQRYRGSLSYAIFGTWKKLHQGPFKYYIIKEVGGWGQKMAILDDLKYCKSSKSWVGGPKKVKNMMT